MTSSSQVHEANVPVQHHERQPPVSFQRILMVKADDGFLLPILQPKVARDLSIVFVGFPITRYPVVELAASSPPTKK
jgi:hypothetical protein